MNSFAYSTSESFVRNAFHADDDVYVMPASVAQERYWILNQMEPENTSLNVPLALRLRGKIDISALRDTLDAIVARHEILRTTFRRRNGAVVQVIAPERSPQLEIIDLSSVPDNTAEGDRLIIEEAHLVFDLARGPLFIPKLIRLGQADHILLLTLHHIVCDGWSNGVLVDEIGRIYEAFSQRRPLPLEELPIQYGDFAAWQKEWLAGEDFEEQLAYWRQQLGSELPTLDIPTDFPRGRNRTSYGAIESLLLPQPLTRAIKAMAQRQDVTLYMVVLAAFKVLLQRYSGQEDILVGSPTANRMRSETEGLIGPFANTLLLKTDLSGDPSFRTLLQRVKEISLGAFSNQTIPFEKLVETVKLGSGRKGAQLFQVLFILQTAFMKPMDASGLSITPIRSVSPGSIFELLLGVVERAEGVRLQLEYNTHLFKGQTIQRMVADLHEILRGAVLDDSRTVSQLLPKRTKSDKFREHADTRASEPKIQARPSEIEVTAGADQTIDEALTKIWQELLNIQSVGLDDDFFELGGHSLLGAQIFDEISKRLGINLSLATLFKATTIRSLSALIRESKPKDNWTSMVPMNTAGTAQPLFLMHAAGGNVLFYKDLVDRLGSDQPCYGLQAVGLDGHQSAYDRIEDMAAHYIKEIRAVQPKGPYYLAGSSMGGMIAYEIALQLHELGEETKLVALFDTYAPGYPIRIPGKSMAILKLLGVADRIQHHIDTLRILEKGKRATYCRAKILKARNSLRRKYIRTKRGLKQRAMHSLGRPLPAALTATQNNIMVAVRAYSPAKYTGDIVLFRATKQSRGIYQDQTLGWSKFVEGRIETHEVVGTHGTLVVEPRVRFVAAKLQEMISKLRTGEHEAI